MSGYLATYLRDHLAGATGGLALARRIAGRDDAIAAAVRPIAGEIAEDRRALEEVMARLGVRPNRAKTAVTAVAERAGRLKPNRHLVTRSPLSPLVELEALSLGVLGKGKLWAAMADAVGDDPRLAGLDLGALERRAIEQHDRLEALRRDAARDALARG